MFTLNIQPTVKLYETQVKGKHNYSNNEFVVKTTEKNIRITKQRIREKSPILKKIEDTEEIKIIGDV
jgi:carbonic anhydrase